MQSLLSAIQYATETEQDDVTYQQWSLKRIYGGMNGITFKAFHPEQGDYPLAVKVRKRDDRQRALREISALELVHTTHPQTAPKPIEIWTDVHDLIGDVVVTDWIKGTVLGDLSDAPQSTWGSIIVALSNVHTQAQQPIPALKKPVFPISSTHELLREIDNRYSILPDGQLGHVTKAHIGKLIDEFKAEALQNPYQTDDLRLTVYDSNPSNMILHEGNVTIVDWENAGWGDPLFDIADLLAGPYCPTLPSSTREWIVERYAQHNTSPEIIPRLVQYQRLMLVFWLILSSRGFGPETVKRFKGSRQFSPEQKMRQQLQYLQRIEAARETKQMA